MVLVSIRTLREDYEAGQHFGKCYAFGAQAGQIYRVDGKCTLEIEDADIEIHGPIQGIMATVFDKGGKKLYTSPRNSLLWSVTERGNDPRTQESFKPRSEESDKI